MAKKSKFDIKDVFPRIGKFLKGFPKNIKPMVKDPVTNMEQLNERRRDVSGMLYFFILFAVVMAILCCLPVVGDIASMLTILPVLGLMFSGFLMWVLAKAEAKFKALTCGKCGKMLDLHTQAEMAKYVTYEIAGEKSKSGVSHPASKDGIIPYVEATGSVSTTVKVAFTCPDCGEVKAFTYFVEPLKLKTKTKKVPVLAVETAKANVTNAIQAILDMYESGDGDKIPYSIQSVHHPRNAEKTKPQTGYENSRGVDIIYHRDIDEMVEGLFIHNELNGTIKSE